MQFLLNRRRRRRRYTLEEIIDIIDDGMGDDIDDELQDILDGLEDGSITLDEAINELIYLGVIPGELIPTPFPSTYWSVYVTTTEPNQPVQINLLTKDYTAGGSSSIQVRFQGGPYVIRIPEDSLSAYTEFARPGTYQIRIAGILRNQDRLEFDNSRDTVTASLVSSVGVIQGIRNFQNADKLFKDCTGLTTIPADLFSLVPEVLSFRDTFAGCTFLTSIPAVLFQNNVAALTFEGVFMGCTRIVTIGTDLFRYNVAASEQVVGEYTYYAFKDAFNGCGNLATIPTDLFRYNVLAADHAFEDTFAGCLALTTVPTDLFRYNVLAGEDAFKETFWTCLNLATVPADLFRYNVAVSGQGYGATFVDCINLVMRIDLWGSGNLQSHFVGRTVNFESFFKEFMFTMLAEGEAPALWDVTGATLTGTDAFGGHSAATLTNYADIPEAWGGP